jgi:phage-related protein
MNFIDGNDSLIGQLLTAYPIIGQVIEGIGDVLRGVWDVVSWIFNTLLSLLQISAEGWRMLGSVVGGWVSDFIANSAIIQGVIATLTGVFDAFGAAAGAVWDWIADKVRAFINVAAKGVELVKSVAGAITGGLDSAKQSLGIGQAQEAIATSAMSPINSSTSNVTANSSRTANKSTSISTGPITVNTQATDGASVAGELNRTLGDQMRQAAATFDDGVAA